MNDDLEDSRDRTIFVEFYPTYRLLSIWRENGTLVYFNAARYASA